MAKSVAEIEFLEKLNFKTEPNYTIGPLKIGLGKIKFEGRGEVSKLTKPDLRYFWDGEKFGLNISNYKEKPIKEILAGLKSEIKEKLQVLYISKTKIKNFHCKDFPNLTYLNLSDNDNLETIKIENSDKLKEVIAFGCKKLTKVEFKGKYDNLEKLDLSNEVIHPKYNEKDKKIETTGLLNKLVLEKAKNLIYLNIQGNQIENLNLSGFPDLEFLFAKNNPVAQITWPEEFNKIQILEVEEWKGINVSLPPILKMIDSELKSELNAFLEQYHKVDSETSIKTLKIILLGNTTIGKSTLRRIFEAKDGEEKEAANKKEDSTHGVNVFFNERFFEKTENSSFNEDEILIQGFDFGGQDYYHSTYRPFIGWNALHILLHGSLDKPENELNPWIKDPYKYDKKLVNDKEEIVFPISYWLGSVLPDGYNKKEDQDTTAEAKEKSEVENEIKKERKIYLEILQNLKTKPKQKPEEKPEQGPFQDINTYDIRKECESNNIQLGSFNTFNFKEEPVEVKKWLNQKIEKYASSSKLLKSDLKFMSWLYANRNKVLFSIEELVKNNEVLEIFNFSEEVNKLDSLRAAVTRLHDFNFGYFFKIKNKEERKDEFFIVNVEKYSNWIHEITLSKTILEEEGYFSKKSIDYDKGLYPHFDFRKTLNFLDKNNIIFNVKNKKDKWVAPSYLSGPKNEFQKILLNSFETPDVVFEFQGFFHSNIILMIIDKFKGSLVKDKQNEVYLMLKNKIFLYQGGENEKAYLLIELKLPGDIDYELKGFDKNGDKDSLDYPRLLVSRSRSGFVENDIFRTVFKFIKNETAAFKPQIYIKTPFNDFIPYSCLNQNNTDNHKTQSHLIYHDETFYSVYDFRHFLLKDKKKPTKIFIGYSHRDLNYVDELLLHLKPYEKQGDIVIFYDRDMKMGDKWDAELKHQLSNSDVFVCLVSPNLLNTDYVMDLELPLAWEKDVKIAPIIIEDCNWKYLKINNGENYLIENQFFEKAKILYENKGDRNREWMEIAKLLKDIPSSSNNKSEENKNGNEHPKTTSPITPVKPDSAN